MKIRKTLSLFIISLFFSNIISAQKLSIAIMGGGQISYSQYYKINGGNTLHNLPYFHTVYGGEIAADFGKIGISLFALKTSYANSISTRAEPGLPMLNTFKTIHYIKPALQVGMSVAKPIVYFPKAHIDILLSVGINKALSLPTQVESIRDSFSTSTAYGMAHLAIHATPIYKNLNMFLGGGVQSVYKIDNRLSCKLSLQYQMGIGMLAGLNEEHYTRGDNLGYLRYFNSSTTNGNNLSLRTSLIYEFGQQ